MNVVVDWGIGKVREVAGPFVSVFFRQRGIVTVDTRSARLSIVRVVPKHPTFPVSDGAADGLGSMR